MFLLRKICQSALLHSRADGVEYLETASRRKVSRFVAERAVWLHGQALCGAGPGLFRIFNYRRRDLFSKFGGSSLFSVQKNSGNEIGI